MTTETASGCTGHPVAAALLDLSMWSMRRVREWLVPMARGRVLEIGVGTGLNLPFYRGVESLTAIDPDPHMLRRARKRAQAVHFPVELIQTGGESLPFERATFDTVVATWVLCTIPDPETALLEARRVLRREGLLLFAEHTASRFPSVERAQQALTPLWKRVSAGCHLDRDAIGMIRRAGFASITARPAGTERWTLAPVYWGTAAQPR